jgi:hypothetical protein
MMWKLLDFKAESRRKKCQKTLIKRNNLSVDPSSDDPY